MSGPRDFLRYVGCVGGKESFVGPRRAEVYPTNKCNLDCIACWSFSPLLAEKERPPPVELDWNVMKGLIRELASCGCEEVLMTGGGEPMLYPRIMESLRLVKSLGMKCFATTNLTRFTIERVREVVEMGLDRLYVSLCAASAHTYSVTHPNAGEETFCEIDRTLRRLRSLKTEKGTTIPRVIMQNVIFNMNFQEVRDMVDYALDVGADAVQFTMIYPLPGSTDVLLLDDAMREQTIRQLNELSTDALNKKGLHGPGTFIQELGLFRQRLVCGKAGEGIYDSETVSELPCEIGWFVTSIRANGDVVPCCKGMNRPMGNLYQKRFRKIWHSEAYDEFREKAKRLPKTDPYFECFDCGKMCDNLGMLKNIRRKMERLRMFETPVRHIGVPLARAVERKNHR